MALNLLVSLALLPLVSAATSACANDESSLLQTEHLAAFGSNLVQNRTDATISYAVSDSRHWFVVGGCVALIVISILPVALYVSVRAFVTVIAYLSALTLVKMWVKEAVNLGIPYPEAITTLHMLGVCCVSFLFERPRKEQALTVFPVAFFNDLSLIANNSALLYGGVAFVSMIAGTGPGITFILELCRGIRTFAGASAMAVLLVCIGGALCIKGELHPTLASAFFAMSSAVLRSMRAVWQSELLTENVSPMSLVFWNGFWSLCITAALMSFGEGLEGYRVMARASPAAQRALICSMCSAVIVNMAQCYAVKALGALMATIVGNLNLVLVIVLSTAWLHETVTLSQYGGVIFLALGTFANKMVDQRLKASAKAETSAESQAASNLSANLKS